MKEPIKSKRVKISFFESPDPAKAIVALPAHPSFHHLGAIICRDNWSPMVFKEDSQNRRIRKSENFEFTDLLVFDVDEGLDIESAKGIILKYDLSALIATTRNHQIQKGKKAACDRFRIVLLLKSSIDEAKKYAELWMTASKVFGSVDQSCKDLARFYFKSKEIVFSHAGKCIDEVNPNSFPPILPQPSAGPKISEMSQGNPADLNDYFNSLSREEGSRNSTVMKFCRQAIATNTPEGKIQEYLLKYCNESGLELKEALVVYGKQKRTNAKKPFSIGKQEKDIGGIFFKSRNNLRYFNKTFYEFNGSHYESYEDETIRILINKFMNVTFSEVLPRSSKVKDVVERLKALCLTKKIEPGCWFNSKTDSSYVNCKNGLVEIDLKSMSAKLLSHSDDFFSLGCVPYSYDPAASPKKFLEVLRQIIPDESVAQVFQEFVGLCLVHDVSHQRFAVLIGESGSGKSVLCRVIRELVGEQNTSSIRLEALVADRSFLVASTHGKLINVIEEVNTNREIAEGTLKDFVAGGEITVEKKYGQPFVIRPTARLIFAVNPPLRFRDRTDGIKRRMLLFPMNQVIAESERNRDFVNRDFWSSSGEMPGILNWALAGLFRLSKRSRFELPPSMSYVTDEFFMEGNPARLFLTEYFDYKPGSTIATSDVYKNYREYCLSNGYSPLGEGQFAAEVSRVFPKVLRTKNAVRTPDKRVRMWVGLSMVAQLPAREAYPNHPF